MTNPAELVRRLRECRICDDTGVLAGEICHRCGGELSLEREAASALEWLARERDTLSEDCGRLMRTAEAAVERADALSRRTARMREALERIIACYDGKYREPLVYAPLQIARAALREGDSA